ncbi:MAG: 4-hydroxyphenylacetate 3-hydroxylase [Acidimicrobiaceae bacterium]|nr:4-hydroxyphenylacetate 3-hydroxylase [Acidimicrobiaceae bacterium]
MRTGDSYVESLRDGRNVILDGVPVEDVASHPAFSAGVRTVARLYDFAADPANRQLMTYESPTDGRPVNLSWLVPRSVDDLRRRRLAIEAWSELSFGYLGRSPDHVASFFAGFSGSLDTFAKAGDRYAENVQRFYEWARDEDLYVTYTIIHPQIDRSKGPHEQYEPNLYASIARSSEDGVVVRGAQMLGTGTLMSDYLFVSSIQPLPPGADDYGLSVAIPVNHPRLRIYPRRPYGRDITAAGDYPLSAAYDETDALVVFDDVDVPAEHVFVDRDRDITLAQFNRTPAHLLGNTQAQIRYAVKMRFLAGLASQLAEWSGQAKDRNFQLSLARVAAQASVPYGMVLAGEYNATIDGNGVARPDPEMLYAAMTLQPALYRDITYALREMTGGTTIQVPSSVSAWDDPVTRADFERFVRWPEVDAEHRVALLKLVWDAIGSEFASRHFQYEMFYAGSASVVQGRLYRNYDWERARSMVLRCLAETPGPHREGDGS